MRTTIGRVRDERRRGRRGSALVYVIVFISVLASMAFSLAMTSMGSMREQRGAREEANALFLAQGAIGEAYFALESGGDGQLGSANDRRFFGGASYWVDASEAGGIRTLNATCSAGSAEARIELTLRETATSLFAWGAFGEERLELGGDARVDGYDSFAGTYMSQQINGSGSDLYANSSGDVGSNGSIYVGQNATVHGSATSGQGYSTTIIPPDAGVDGSTAPSPSVVSLPPIDLPTFASSGPLSVPSGATVSIPPGDHAFDDLRVDTNGTIRITGPATLVFDSFELGSQGQFLVDATLGPVEVYVVNDFILGDDARVASLTESPRDIAFNLLADNAIDPDLDVELDGSGGGSGCSLYGTIYAPRAAIEVDNAFELFGAIVARSLVLDSDSRIHYDEQLAAVATDAVVTYEVIAQRVLK